MAMDGIANPMKPTRRSFLATSAAASTLPLFSIGAPGESANDKINMAVVGAGGMGGYAMGESRKQNLVAICDIDENRAAKAFQQNPDATRFKDFRQMLADKGEEIDAVCISTPDHTHFPIAMACIQAGKHIFVQKPLAHNIWQLRTLAKAARKHKVITQMGNQGHTFPGMRRIKEWVDAGMVGEVTEVITWTNRPNPPWFVPPPEFPPPAEDVPAHLDWDLWQGPAAERPYSSHYVPVKWRGWWDYGCGGLGDIGCHTLDAPFWTLGLGLPTKVEIDRKEPPGEGFIPMSSVVTYHFPARGDKPPVVMKWFERGYDVPKPKRWDADKPLPGQGGMYMEGSENTLFHAGMRPNSPQFTPNERFNELKPELAKIERLPEVGNGPIDELFRAIKGGPAPGSNFDYATELTEVVLLGALAQRTGKTIEWDAENMKVKGQPELDTLIKEPVRDGWSYGEDLW